MRLKEKVAIVTGGAGGIGWATCKLFGSEGSKIAIADLMYENAERSAQQLSKMGYDVKAIKVDVTRLDDAKQMVEKAVDYFGKVDILVNLAGGSAGPFLKTKHSLFAESDEERWQEVINLNLYGTLNCTRAVISHMIERRAGKIINTGSIAGIIGMQWATEYSAAKAGIVGFTKSLAKEVAPYGINVNCVSPGMIATERVRQMTTKGQDSWLDGIPLGRLGEPVEVAAVIVFLASDESYYITGVNIPVTGGLTLGPKGY